MRSTVAALLVQSDTPVGSVAQCNASRPNLERRSYAAVDGVRPALHPAVDVLVLVKGREGVVPARAPLAAVVADEREVVLRLRAHLLQAVRDIEVLPPRCHGQPASALLTVCEESLERLAGNQLQGAIHHRVVGAAGELVAGSEEGALFLAVEPL